MSLEDSKEFSLSLLNLYGSLITARNAAGFAISKAGGDTPWDHQRETASAAAGEGGVSTAWYRLGNSTVVATLSAACEVTRSTARDVAWDVAVKAAEKMVDLRKTPRQVADAACRSVVANRKEIKRAVRVKVWDKVPNVLLSWEKKKIIRELDRLKKTIPLQLCNIFFRIEYIIRVNASLEGKDEKELLKEHSELIEDLGLMDCYTKLFASPIKVEMIDCLPTVLANIVVGYTSLSCFDADDVDEIFRRILLMPKEE